MIKLIFRDESTIKEKYLWTFALFGTNFVHHKGKGNKIPDKILGKKQRNSVKLDRARKDTYLLLCDFWLLLPKFDF